MKHRQAWERSPGLQTRDPFGGPVPAARAWVRQPPSPYDATLSLAASAWLKGLPPNVAPVELASQFPRIVNRLARFWDSPKMIEEYFADLLVDRRGGRKGFPRKIADELYALADYYRVLHKKADTDVWNSIPYHRR